MENLEDPQQILCGAENLQSINESLELPDRGRICTCDLLQTMAHLLDCADAPQCITQDLVKPTHQQWPELNTGKTIYEIDTDSK